MRKRYKILPNLKRFPEGFPNANGYLLETEKGIVLFDPGMKPSDVPESDEVTLLIATHGHYDHIGKINEWQSINSAPFWISTLERDLLKNSASNASSMFGRPTQYPEADRYLEDGEVIDLDAKLHIKTYSTPGHTPGSMCFLIVAKNGDKDEPIALITGDTLFDDSFGRTDLPGGSSLQMAQSLKFLYSLIQELPQDLPVCPGHGNYILAEDILSSPVWHFARTLLGE